jgi:hypothetical protein
MNEQILEYLSKLAEKLGTTSEYLWSVLLRQAPISGAIDLLIVIVIVTAVVLFIRFVRRKTVVPAATEENPDPYPEWENELVVFVWLGIIVATTLALLIVVDLLGDGISGLVNPEYWALKQILN